MRYSIATTAAFLALAVAIPSPRRRTDGACKAAPAGNGPAVTNPDTPDHFLSYPEFQTESLNAVTPSGYTLVPGFQNLQASAEAGNYMGVNSEIASYDPSICSAQCDTMEGCVAFNIFFERNPVVHPNATKCPNPSSLTRMRCAFYGETLTSSEATNAGSYQYDFHRVITGSNAYTNVPAAVSGFSGPVTLGAGIIQPPDGDSSYMGNEAFTDPTYNPQACADSCNAKSAYNTEHGIPSAASPRTCAFFDAYILLVNDANPTFHCAYYTQAWDASYATNKGQWDSNNNHYTITKSYSYTISSS